MVIAVVAGLIGLVALVLAVDYLAFRRQKRAVAGGRVGKRYSGPERSIDAEAHNGATAAGSNRWTTP